MREEEGEEEVVLNIYKGSYICKDHFSKYKQDLVLHNVTLCCVSMS